MLKMHSQIRRDDRDRGFTLVELLLVIVILGVLAGVVVASLSGLSNKSAQGACKTEVASLQNTIEEFKITEGVFPDAPVGVVAISAAVLNSMKTGTADIDPDTAGVQTQTYLATVPNANRLVDADPSGALAQDYVLRLADSTLGDGKNRPTVSGWYKNTSGNATSC